MLSKRTLREAQNDKVSANGQKSFKEVEGHDFILLPHKADTPGKKCHNFSLHYGSQMFSLKTEIP